MRPTVSRVDVIGMLAKVRESMMTSAEREAFLADWQADTVESALLSAYAGVTNGFLSQLYEAMTSRKAEVLGEVEKLLPCPCCGRRTLSELFDADLGTGYDVCDHCGWEDAGTSDPAQWSGPNRGTMLDYRGRLETEGNYFQREKWPR